MRNVRTLPLSFSGFPAIRLFFLLSAAAAHPGLTRRRRGAEESGRRSPGLGQQPVQRRVSARRWPTSGVMPSDFQPDGGDWAVRGTQNGWFELQWDQPVEAAQIVYYARTTSPLLECLQGLRGLRERRTETRGAGHAGTPPRPAEDRVAEAARDADPHRVPLVASGGAQPRRGGDRRLSRAGHRRGVGRHVHPAGREDAPGAGAAQGPDRRAVRLPRHPAGQTQAAGHLARLRLPRRGLPARRRAVSLHAGRERRPAEVHLRRRPGHDHHGRPVLRRPGDRLRPAPRRPCRVESHGPHRRHLALPRRGEQLPPLPHQHRRDRAGATDARRAQQPRPVLAARRRHRLHVRPQAGLCLLLGHHLAGPLPHGTRRLEAEAALGELPDGFHALGAQQRADHLHPLGIRGPPGLPHPKPLDHQPGRHRAGRLLRQPRAFARHVHGRAADPQHRLRDCHRDEPQRSVPRRDRGHRPQPRAPTRARRSAT